MGITSETHPYPAPTAWRLSNRSARPRPRRATGQAVRLTPAMGPPNRAPGISIMGGANGIHPYAMSGADAGPHASVMGVGDRGPRLDLFGESDIRFVDSLFSGHDRTS